MWDLLKSKVSNFISKIKKNEESTTVAVESKKNEEDAKPTVLTEEKKSSGVKINVGIKDKLKKAILKKIKLDKNKIDEIADELELSLIQADVHPDVATDICNKIRRRMSEAEFSKKNLEEEVKQVLKDIFMEEAFGNGSSMDIVERVKQCEKPCKILFVGPNGAGKTTTLAKVAHLLMKNGFKVVVSASDTFRAAAIEQTEEHGKRLGIKVVRHNYGADAAAVAYDAVKHAEANKIDVVLIDSAGRQDTNANLLRELQKLKRVINPNLIIFIGESIAGSSLYQQVETFKNSIGLDGVILTKIDCDAKGGVSISIMRETGVPVIYLGVGQGYEDLVKFSHDFVISNII